MSLPPPLQQVDRIFVRVNGRKLVYFGGCDYFRLASHPKVLKAMETGLRRYGLNVSASRLTTGNHEIYEKLEHALEDFFDAESATLASNGYEPNLIVAQTLAGSFSHALLDERAHNCLRDSVQLLNCPVINFKHRDANDLARQLKRFGKIKPLLLTDGMFAHDGSIAPVKEYLKVLPRNGMILLDDAHGAGVLGRNGRGTVEYSGVPTTRIIRTITLSKAFGVYGGAILGTKKLRELIITKSRMFIGNTPLPLPLASAAIEAIAILKRGKNLRARLMKHAAFVKKRLTANGLKLTDTPGLIVIIIPKELQEAAALEERLLARGIHPPFIKYPGGPESGYFRFAISSGHSRAQLEALVVALIDH